MILFPKRKAHKESKQTYDCQMGEGVQFSYSVLSNSATPWIAACQASLSITNSWSPHKPISIKSMIPSNHLILCHPLLLLPSIFPSIRVFSNESALRIRWPKYWSFSFNISPSSEQPGLISFRTDCWISLQSKGLSRVFSNTTVQKHQFFCTQLWRGGRERDILGGGVNRHTCSVVSDSLRPHGPGSSVHEILQARILGWSAISFSNIYTLYKTCSQQEPTV